MTESGTTGGLKAVAQGGKAALASALARFESDPQGAETLSLLGQAYGAPRGWVTGMTGPPGVGKSTLASALIKALRKAGRSVAMVAVDPSSRASGGALLGDRARLALDGGGDVFMRSMAARMRLGGLAPLTNAYVVLLRALFDDVLVETVGVGQSETDIADTCDTVLLCLQPESGDTLQFMKAGVMEIPDIAVVAKGDMGASAARAARDVASLLAMVDRKRDAWSPSVVTVSALHRGREGDEGGVDTLLSAIMRHRAWLGRCGRLAARRAAQAESWVKSALRERYGDVGLRRVGFCGLQKGEDPFSHLNALARRLDAGLYAGV